MPYNKTLVFVLCFFTAYVYPQWQTGKSENKFDGKYVYDKKIGKGGEWRYIKRMLAIHGFNDKEPSIYITNVGYTGGG